MLEDQTIINVYVRKIEQRVLLIQIEPYDKGIPEIPLATRAFSYPFGVGRILEILEEDQKMGLSLWTLRYPLVFTLGGVIQARCFAKRYQAFHDSSFKSSGSMISQPCLAQCQ